MWQREVRMRLSRTLACVLGIWMGLPGVALWADTPPTPIPPPPANGFDPVPIQPHSPMQPVPEPAMSPPASAAPRTAPVPARLNWETPSATTWGAGPAAGTGPFWAPGGYEARSGSPYHYHAPNGEHVVTGDPYYDHFGPGFHRHSLHGHYRFPYYNYRAPWYYPGRAVYNRDTNQPW